MPSDTLSETHVAERKRLSALRALAVLDTPPVSHFDHIVHMMRELLDVPIALISLVDEERQWFMAKCGLDADEAEREISFCTHAIQQDSIFEICDAAKDPMFADNPLVTGEPFIRYYAGQPLRLSNGHTIGTLCAIDTVPRAALGDRQRYLLRGLADTVVQLFELDHSRALEKISEAIGKTTGDGVLISDEDGRIIGWNPGAEKMFGWKLDEIRGQSISRIMPERFRKQHIAGMRRVVKTGKHKLSGKTVELEGLKRSGEEFPIELSLTNWKVDTGHRRAGFAAIVRDISARKALEYETKRTKRFLQAVVDNLPSMLFVKDAETLEYKYWNSAAEELTGLSAREVLGSTDRTLFPDEADGYEQRDRQAIDTGEVYLHESVFTPRDGAERRVRTKRIVYTGAEGRPYLMGISEDVTEHHKAQSQIKYLAHYDSVTKIRNRNGFLKEFRKSMKNSEKLGILSVDLDRFKVVNDAHGHAPGDKVLHDVAQRMVGILKDDEIVCRYGGDEFAVICVGDDVKTRAARLGEQIIAVMEDPFLINGKAVFLGCSIGVALAPQDGDNDETLLQAADLSLYRAKHEGRNCMRFYEPDLYVQVHEHIMLENDLREAVRSRELTVAYQPIENLDDGTTAGFEVLARWNHAERGAIGPDVFIPIAEESNVICDLGDYVFETALAEASAWDNDLYLAINLSPVQFAHGNIVRRIEKALSKFGFDPARLELEITEGVLIHDRDRALDKLRDLKAMGIKIVMDDFGTGYSSLSYFQLFPFDKVKIDRSFVSSMHENRQAKAIVKAVIGLAEALDMPVVAEGIEHDHQLSSLRQQGCVLAQGYLMGRPGPIEYFSHLIYPQDSLPVARRA